MIACQCGIIAEAEAGHLDHASDLERRVAGVDILHGLLQHLHDAGAGQLHRHHLAIVRQQLAKLRRGNGAGRDGDSIADAGQEGDVAFCLLAQNVGEQGIGGRFFVSLPRLLSGRLLSATS